MWIALNWRLSRACRAATELFEIVLTNEKRAIDARQFDEPRLVWEQSFVAAHPL
jgi:hypothetical protein